MNALRIFLVFYTAGIAWIPHAYSAAATAATNAASDTGSGWLQVIFGFFMVALLLAGSLYALKRLAIPRNPGALLRVISGVSLGPRERVVIVETGETWLILGVTAGQINKLHELPRQTLLVEEKPPTTARPDFAQLIRQALEHRHAR